jgi:hypothetical protein
MLHYQAPSQSKHTSGLPFDLPYLAKYFTSPNLLAFTSIP